ncbi:copper-binding protein [uncultured Sulfitobacter sp.]|uniref:copper-binding protein n=1 Tax=uncultured Sulfitobacter sp. TaxID=191468 RepID=UPI002603BE3A|nr:copper-binding protein [uncultured Sulfitobacter sp.]
MKNLMLTTAIVFTFTLPGYAAGTHGGGHGANNHDQAEMHGGAGHGDHHAEMMVGMPGDAAKVDRTIKVTMIENGDGEMLFEGDKMIFEQGETIRFVIENKGALEHEFVLDTVEGNAEHKTEMAKMDMEHDDPNSIRLDAGATGEVIWTFANDGAFEAACLIPGHYESGMHRAVAVGERAMMEDMKMASAEGKAAPAEVAYTKGKVTKLDAKGGKVTIDHGPLLNLDMPAMKMVFRADEAMMSKLSEGQEIEFVAEPVKGKLTVTQLR